jgi:hypothetical protein
VHWFGPSPEGRALDHYPGPVSSQRVRGGVVDKIPADLRAALITNPTALDAWNDITPLARNEFICWVENAKQATTRERRIRRTRVGAAGRPASALLLAGVQPPGAHRPIATGATSICAAFDAGCRRIRRSGGDVKIDVIRATGTSDDSIRVLVRSGYESSTSAETTSGKLGGTVATPIAVRACEPTSWPKTLTMSSDSGFRTSVVWPPCI